VEVFSPKGDAAQVYRALWEEIDRRLDNALLEINRQLP
jgi:hypothetical protein